MDYEDLAEPPAGVDELVSDPEALRVVRGEGGTRVGGRVKRVDQRERVVERLTDAGTGVWSRDGACVPDQGDRAGGVTGDRQVVDRLAERLRRGGDDLLQKYGQLLADQRADICALRRRSLTRDDRSQRAAVSAADRGPSSAVGTVS